MAYVTPLYGGSDAQVDYRLGLVQHGCDSDVQLGYRTDARERPLRWFGSGLDAFGVAGVTAGAELTADQFQMARRLVRGAHPGTGEQLVAPKVAVPADAKLSLSPLVAAVNQTAATSGVNPAALFQGERVGRAWAAAARGAERRGARAVSRADEATALAEAAGLDPDAVWGRDAVAEALGNLSQPRAILDEQGKPVLGPDGIPTMERVVRRERVGIAAYDIGITLPKSLSVLLAMAPEELTEQIEGIYAQAAERTLSWAEARTSYVKRGHHGGGRSARQERSSGMSGWVMTHRAARPVGEFPTGDPHWHVHITVANLAQAPDGTWLTIGAGGRELMRHAPAIDKLTQAQVRAELHRTLGISFARSEATGLWEVDHIPQPVLELFSKRHAQVTTVLAALGYSNTTTSAKDARVLTRTSRSGKSETTAAADVTLRDYWRAQAISAGYDPAEWMPAVLANYQAAHPGRASEATARANATMLARHGITLDDVVARLTDPEHGLTAHTRRFSHLEAVTATADALPYGASAAEVEALTELVLAHPAFVAIPEHDVPAASMGEHVQLAGSHEMAGGRLYTTADIPAAEQAILDLVAASRPEQARAVVAEDTLAMAVEVTEAAQGYALSTEQRQVLAAMCTGGRAVESLEGPAGTGKTTVMRAARVAWEAQGLVVAGAATAAVAAQGLAAESGIAARTCAQWLRRIQTGPGLTGVDVLVLDEANLTDDRDRAALYAEAVRADVSKVVEVQDPKQLSTPGCGSMAGYLHAVLDGPRLTENRRQRNEDERAALAVHRDGRYLPALSTYDRLGQVLATLTSDAGVAQMVASWLRAAQGAPDAHIRAAGLVMLAATNDTVTRINEAVQAVRAAEDQLGEAATYALPGGRQVRFCVGDQVLIRRNDRTNAATSGQPVLNGYRGVVTGITPAGVQVAWRQPGDTPDQQPHTAICEPGYIADGGLDLGYCLTTHKAEGMTIKGAWDRPDGSRNEGTVLVWAPGMDARAQYVGLSRDAGQVIVFGALDQVEGEREQLVYGAPRSQQELTQRVLAALAEHAAATATCPDDRPVLVDLGQAPSQQDHRAHHAYQQRAPGPSSQDHNTPAHPPAAHTEPESVGAGGPEVTQQAGPGQHPLPGDGEAHEGEQRQHGVPSGEVTVGLRGYWGDEGWRELTRQLQQVALSDDLPALRAAFEQRHAYETEHLDPHGEDRDQRETWEQYVARVVVTDEHRQRWQELSVACVQAWRDKDPAAQAAKTAYAQALGPDRAARLRQETFDHLDALRAQRHAQQQWLVRPFGTLTDDQLQRAITEAEHTRVVELAAAERARTKLAEIEAAVAAGTGPRVTGQDSQLAELRRVAELADQAYALNQRLRDAQARASWARTQALTAQHRAQQVSWWRPGKRDRLAADAAQHAATWRQVRTEIDVLTQRIQQIRDEAPAALHNLWRHRDTLARAEANYPDDRRHAQRLDEHQLTALRAAISARHSAAATAAQRRDALGAEQQLRAEMSPRQNTTEHVQRAHWILEQRRAAAHRAATEDHHQADHTRSYYDRSHTLDQGHDHGLSL